MNAGSVARPEHGARERIAYWLRREFCSATGRDAPNEPLPSNSPFYSDADTVIAMAQGAEARPSGEAEHRQLALWLEWVSRKCEITFASGDRGQRSLLASHQNFDRIVALLRTPASVVQPQEWQPIESAPTDRAIMMYDVAFGVYDTGRLWSPETMPQPTHWMPLPAAPTDRRVTEDGP